MTSYLATMYNKKRNFKGLQLMTRKWRASKDTTTQHRSSIEMSFAFNRCSCKNTPPRKDTSIKTRYKRSQENVHTLDLDFSRDTKVESAGAF